MVDIGSVDCASVDCVSIDFASVISVSYELVEVLNLGIFVVDFILLKSMIRIILQYLASPKADGK